MDVLTRGIQDDVPWRVFFANDIVIIDETKAAINEKVEQWKVTLETRGSRVSHSKTEYCGVILVIIKLRKGRC